MTALPKLDQQWILGQLTPAQLKQFDACQGNALLSKARRFRNLPYTESQLPHFCNELKQQAPLYVAIILQQGNFQWQQEFLDSFQQGAQIQQLLKQAIHSIKPAVQLSLFQHWQHQLHSDVGMMPPSFSALLEH
ncbi:MAG: hypothetical protein ACHP65_01355 [Legionellales bacterium]